MAATRTRSTPSSNGGAAHSAAERAKEAGSSVTSAARKAKVPMLAAGATAAGLAGGLALGSRLGSRRTVLGVPVGRRSGLIKTAQALGKLASEMSSARNQASATTDDVRQIREQLDKANRRSPIEVVLDGLTHRRGAHKRES